MGNGVKRVKGTVSTMRREKCACPQDGVHRQAKDGTITGAKAVLIDKTIVPKGMTLFYVKGHKVFYGFRTGQCAKLSVVAATMHRQKQLYKYGLAPYPKGIERIELRLKDSCGKVHKTVWGYRTQHVDTRDTLHEYFAGKPYQWKGSDNPKKFKEFVEKAKRIIRHKRLKISLKESNFGIGNVLWDKKKKRYYLVDCG